MELVWIVALVVAVAVICAILLAMRPAARRSDELEGRSWDERTRPTNDPFFRNMEYYSKH